MQKVNDLPVLSENLTERKLTRRQAARILLSGIAAGTAMPWGTQAHPVWKHFEDEHLMSHAEAAEVGGKLHFLDAQQFESLAALAEAVVPGSKKTNVASFVDLLLGVDTAKHQKEFVSSLAAIESESDGKYGKRFAALSDAAQIELLTNALTAPRTQAGELGLRDAFNNLKEWISGAYYSSEIGMRELGWTPDRVFAEFPGCSHAEGHD
jgi:Gluconate 2-dehydrogenase subunit 3